MPELTWEAGDGEDARAGLRDGRRDQRNVDLILSAVLQEPEALKGIQYPLAYVDFLRTCIEPVSHSVEVVKEDSTLAALDKLCAKPKSPSQP